MLETIVMIGVLVFPLACLLGGAIMLAMIPIRACDYPQCARCKHNLTGLANPRICPECGFELFRGGIVNPGDNHKRKVMIAGGILLIVSTPFVGYFMLGVLARTIF